MLWGRHDFIAILKLELSELYKLSSSVIWDFKPATIATPFFQFQPNQRTHKMIQSEKIALPSEALNS